MGEIIIGAHYRGPTRKGEKEIKKGCERVCETCEHLSLAWQPSLGEGTKADLNKMVRCTSCIQTLLLSGEEGNEDLSPFAQKFELLKVGME